MKIQHSFLLIIIYLFFISCSNKSTNEFQFKIVFIAAEEEYRSEESMPMLAKILKRELKAEVHVCYPLDSNGFINPNQKNHIDGLENLVDADLMVIYAHTLELPQNELDQILDFINAGKPIVGFRSSTQLFDYKSDSSKFYLNANLPKQVFGQSWVTHHGNFDNGMEPLTNIMKPNRFHPILKGVNEFGAHSAMYHVDGSGWNLAGDSKPMIFGRALKSVHMDNLETYPLSNPVGWTKTHIGANGEVARLFFTTLGHPYDFKNENMRKLTLNGIYWTLGISDFIPENGVNTKTVGKYDPSPSGIDKFRTGVKPKKI